MALSSDRVVRMILNLFPTGIAWAKDPGSKLYQYAQAMGVEVDRFQARVDTLINEADPRTAYELLEDWERIAGLPDSCTQSNQTLDQRRKALVTRLTAVGSLNKQFYINLAASLGYAVTIREYRPFQTGRSKTGDALTNGNWIYTWTVIGPANTAKYFQTGQSVTGEPLRYVANQLLECTITKLKPSHTLVTFSYTG